MSFLDSLHDGAHWRMLAQVIELAAGDARTVVVAEAGGRLGSLTVGGHELLVTGGPHAQPMMWGSWPMAPYAGRVRAGRFRHDDVDHQLPLSLPPHAAHGTVFDRAWTPTAAGPSSVELRCDLGDDWPLGGVATQRIELEPNALRCTLAVTAADRSMPAEVGWHAFYRVADGVEDAVRVAATAMYERGGDELPTGRLVAPRPPPWDDCFLIDGSLTFQVGRLAITVASDTDHVVVFHGPDGGVAVEPQSGPPDAFHLAPRVLAPHERVRRTMTVRWEQGGEATSPTDR